MLFTETTVNPSARVTLERPEDPKDKKKKKKSKKDKGTKLNLKVFNIRKE